MTYLIAKAVRAKISHGHWCANNDHATREQDDAIEQRAFETTLTDDEIIEAAKECQEADLALIAKWAMSGKIGEFVELVIK